MIEYDSNLQDELFDILQESIGIGLGKAASVIGQLTDSHVALSTTKVYTADKVLDLPMFSERVVIMEVQGDALQGETIFSMNDDQLITLIKYLEGFEEMDVDDEEIMDLIADTYQEIGNIILGNIISSMVDFFGIRVDIQVPYTMNKIDLDSFSEKKLLVVDVIFTIDRLETGGKLYFINDYNAYMKLAKAVYDSYET